VKFGLGTEMAMLVRRADNCELEEMSADCAVKSVTALAVYYWGICNCRS
jgi:hypothetical protein